jgi:hypothetical protein
MEKLLQGIPMGVILRLQDGTVKKYLFGQNKRGKKTQCGASDCEHVDCAIGDREASAREMRLIMYISPVGTIIILAALYFFVLEEESLLITAAAAALVIIMEIVIFFFYRWIVGMYDDEVRELREFRDRGTVNGIPAQQVHGNPAARGD